MFIQVDFGLVRDASGEFQPKLVELQAFPSLYAYQPVLARTFIDVYGSGSGPSIFAGRVGLRIVLVIAPPGDRGRSGSGERNPDGDRSISSENAARFPADGKAAGHSDSRHRAKSRKLETDCTGRKRARSVPIKRIYNRAIVDELERKGAKLNFDFRDDLDVEWAGHPNWYFRISQVLNSLFEAPVGPKDMVPRPATTGSGRSRELCAQTTVFVCRARRGHRTRKRGIAAVPAERGSQYILQERLHFEPVIDTPFGGTKVEVRVMYIWVDELSRF